MLIMVQGWIQLIIKKDKTNDTSIRLFTSWWELEPSDIIINYCSGVNVNFF